MFRNKGFSSIFHFLSISLIFVFPSQPKKTYLPLPYLIDRSGRGSIPETVPFGGCSLEACSLSPPSQRAAAPSPASGGAHLRSAAAPACSLTRPRQGPARAGRAQEERRGCGRPPALPRVSGAGKNGPNPPALRESHDPLRSFCYVRSKIPKLLLFFFRIEVGRCRVSCICSLMHMLLFCSVTR